MSDDTQKWIDKEYDSPFKERKGESALKRDWRKKKMEEFDKSLPPKGKRYSESDAMWRSAYRTGSSSTARPIQDDMYGRDLYEEAKKIKAKRSSTKRSGGKN